MPVIMAARDEESTVGPLVSRLRALGHRVIVAESGSRDRTAAVAEAAGAEILRVAIPGKGRAVAAAARLVQTDPVVILMDADGSHDPGDIPAMVAPILSGRADHVGGSRLLGGSSELHGGFGEVLRLSAAAFITWAIGAAHGARLSDSQNGFRAMLPAILAMGARRAVGTTLEQELVAATLEGGWRYAEIPSHELPRSAGRSKVRLCSPLTWLAYGISLAAILARAWTLRGRRAICHNPQPACGRMEAHP